MKKISPHIREFAKRILHNKLSLESEIAGDLKRYFNQVSVSVVSNRETPSIKDIIEKHNNRVVSKLVRPGKLKDLRTKLIDHAIKNNRGLVTTHWTEVDRRTRELIAQSKEVARDLLTDKKTDEKGNVIALEYKADAQSLNKTTAKVLNNYNQNRIQGIAITETNTMYEAANNDIFSQLQSVIDDDIESGDIDDIDMIDNMYDSVTFDEVAEGAHNGEDKHKLRAIVIEALQTWITMGDDKVRDAHAEMEGQQVPVGEPFDCDGYDMYFPGDDSGGAPAELWINCRCSAVR